MILTQKVHNKFQTTTIFTSEKIESFDLPPWLSIIHDVREKRASLTRTHFHEGPRIGVHVGEAVVNCLAHKHSQIVSAAVESQRLKAICLLN